MKELLGHSSRSGRVVVALFIALVLLQLMDLHATLTASASQVERNRLITWLSQQVPFPVVVAAIKAADVAMVGVLYVVWRRTAGRLEGEFALCLSTAVLVYAGVVANNYLR